MRSTTRRWTTRGSVAAGTVLATMLLAGSLSQASASAPAASAASQSVTADGAYRQCFRDHGGLPKWDPDHPRPRAQAGAPDVNREKIREAREKCAEHPRPAWSSDSRYHPGPHQRERAGEMRSCLEDRGITVRGEPNEQMRDAIKDCRAEMAPR